AVQCFVIKHFQWILDKIRYFEKFPAGMLLKGNRRDFLKYKENARMRVQERLIHFNQTYNFAFNAVSIRNQKTRWGSCSRKGNLNFNYRIALLPERLADYIIVHEMCHLKELNHSKQFWHLVSHAFPDHVVARNELKKM
ncbi:MAG: M48 family metallopeptidase, partial [bacterium]|nr:M48 family metallopeptidase [bacterium]